MLKKSNQQKDSQSMQKLTHIQTVLAEKTSRQRLSLQLPYISGQINESTKITSSQQNNHNLICLKAQQHFQQQNYSQTIHQCLKAFQIPSKCFECIKLYQKAHQLISSHESLSIDQILSNQNLKSESNVLYHQFLKLKQKNAKIDQFQDLFKDLKQNGAKFNKISIVSQIKQNRTVIAKQNIQRDETILFIPKDKLILLENARKSPIVQKIHEEKLYLRSPKHCQLSIFLLEHIELGEKSPYYFYIKHLPKTFDNFPINYKPQELEYLKGSPFLDQIQQKNLDIKRDYQAIISVYPEFNKYCFESFRKCRLLVSSRIFGIVINYIRTDALAPLADMLNHNIPKQTSWFYSDQMEGFMIKSVKPIQKGQQIYDSYGQKCNSRFLLNYGFTVLQNNSNEMAFKIPIEYQEEQKVEIYSEVTLRVSKNIESKQFQQLLAILRFSIVHDRREKKQSLELMKETPFMGSQVQSQIWQKLQTIIQSQLASYPQTLKEDKKLLASKDISINHYNCIVLRKGEKQILHFYLTMAKKMIKFFRLDDELKRVDQFQQFSSYLKKLNFS